MFRQGDRPIITLDPLRRGEGISLERVIPYAAGHLLQCNIHHIEEGGESAEYLIPKGKHILEQGDSFVFGSNLPHAYRNAGNEPASIFWVNTPPTF